MLQRLISVLVFLLGALLGTLTAQAETLELHQASFVASTASQPPPPHANWQAQTLPDEWRNTHDPALESGWYQFRIQRLAPDASIQAVYLPKLGMNAAVWLNDTFIGNGGNMQEPLSRNWNRPLLFPIPHGVLREGENILYIHLRGARYSQPILNPVYLGSEASLRPLHDSAIFQHITLSQVTTLLIAAIGLLTLSLWWRRKQETAYAYFGISALVWSINSANLYVRDVPFSVALWETLVNASVQVFAALLLISLLRFIGMWKDGYRYGFLTLLLASPVTLAIVPTQHFLQATAFWHLATVAATLFTLVLTLKAAFVGNREARLLVGALSLIIVFALHDWAMHSAHLWHQYSNIAPTGTLHLMQYGAPVLYLAVGWIMTSRYLRTLDEFERLNNELDQRVRDKQAELQANYSRMQQLEMEHAVASERERIHGDLHDDVGAKLLSLVYRAGNAENAELARSALQDLRDVVSQTSVSTRLAELAADWRAECDKRLTEAHIHLDWDEQGELASAPLTQPQALNLTRIVREAVSNIIRHSTAQTGFVRLRCTQDHLTLEISDNGKGCPHTHNPGRGLRNMAARAQKLGGKLVHYTPHDCGHGVRLEMPLAKTAA